MQPGERVLTSWNLTPLIWYVADVQGLRRTPKERIIKSGKAALIPDKSHGVEMRLFTFYSALGHIYFIDSQNLRKLGMEK